MINRTRFDSETRLLDWIALKTSRGLIDSPDRDVTESSGAGDESRGEGGGCGYLETDREAGFRL